ncbi:unnamed protein product [Schistosoma rodhaini]|uniref:Glycosyltransferase-like protein LARGE1 n=1 Tax=Schistosoma rodhaini TaxID=6188 RepID=A0AA85EKI5_9TREM|nr:unnamed protein product [Schistosoma rodhaini]CAH8678595.1 unnamed protein product [Schistosoma rodhaini]
MSKKSRRHHQNTERTTFQNLLTKGKSHKSNTNTITIQHSNNSDINQKNFEQKKLKVVPRKFHYIMNKRFLFTCLLILFLYLCIVLIKSTIIEDKFNHDENEIDEKRSNSLYMTLNSIREINDQDISYELNNEYDLQQKISLLKNSNHLMPTLCIGVLVRNKAHTLPYFLNGIENQQYPTKRITLIFYVDNTIDSSEIILNKWIQCNKDKYHRIILEVNTTKSEYEHLSKMWTLDHYLHVISLRQKLLDEARNIWADFYLSIDADVILMNPLTIEHLINVMLDSTISKSNLNHKMDENIIILAPLMNCTSSEHYSNFWGAMSEEGYYLRSEHYFDIQKRRIQGVYPVAMVHSIFLVNLQFYQSEQIGYSPAPINYTGPIDDIIIFSRSVQRAEIDFYLDNTQFYGYIPSPVEEQDLGLYSKDLNNAWLLREQDLFVHLRLQAIIDQEDKQRVMPSECLLNIAENQLPKSNKLNFDEIYFINLLRRPDRRQKMEYMLHQLGINAKHYAAIDGKDLTMKHFDELEIKQLPGYTDPYHNRSLKFGEIGCFLSHYNIWMEMINNGYNRILILEDDLRFAPAFVRNLNKVIKEADDNVANWDLLYIGRKRMSKSEKRVPNTTSLTYPDYTYWTLGYILSRNGAEKLIKQKPLKKLIAIDEYLPVMFNKHPRKDWLVQFEPRDLIALSAEPLLVEPQRYTGEKRYISDTEDSEIFYTT